MSRAPLKTSLQHGQRYVDEPVYAEVSKAKPLAIAINAIGRTPGRRQALPVMTEIREISHYNRIQLRWMKPDGKGGLVPRKS